MYRKSAIFTNGHQRTRMLSSCLLSCLLTVVARLCDIQSMRMLGISLVTAFFSATAANVSAQPADAKGVEFFEARIRPVLVEHCYKCHSEEARQNRKLKADLLLDTRAGLLKGGVSGPALIAGKPNESRLLRALRHDGDCKCPPAAS
jgi:uncharacterized membrane protein